MFKKTSKMPNFASTKVVKLLNTTAPFYDPTVVLDELIFGRKENNTPRPAVIKQIAERNLTDRDQIDKELKKAYKENPIPLDTIRGQLCEMGIISAVNQKYQTLNLTFKPNKVRTSTPVYKVDLTGIYDAVGEDAILEVKTRKTTKYITPFLSDYIQCQCYIRISSLPLCYLVISVPKAIHLYRIDRDETVQDDITNLITTICDSLVVGGVKKEYRKNKKMFIHQLLSHITHDQTYTNPANMLIEKVE